jgi:hypothetical protein
VSKASILVESGDRCHGGYRLRSTKENFWRRT